MTDHRADLPYRAGHIRDRAADDLTADPDGDHA